MNLLGDRISLPDQRKHSCCASTEVPAFHCFISSCHLQRQDTISFLFVVQDKVALFVCLRLFVLLEFSGFCLFVFVFSFVVFNKGNLHTLFWCVTIFNLTVWKYYSMYLRCLHVVCSKQWCYQNHYLNQTCELSLETFEMLKLCLLILIYKPTWYCIACRKHDRNKYVWKKFFFLKYLILTDSKQLCM